MPREAVQASIDTVRDSGAPVTKDAAAIVDNRWAASPRQKRLPERPKPALLCDVAHLRVGKRVDQRLRGDREDGVRRPPGTPEGLEAPE